ncbi:MAG: esterase-like activity of phytase family protein [Pseudomonas sp.]|uniref:esterase-like activity of phytase family protein n=1 Tax=Pseudomonas sp. TaxID=306 RepID=UPI00121B5B77|nr:esterase-like activity of phytase family protein [Pseudomonas sp.]RZI67197.1 MAG: esterase-like activity of phytase family protein [Pseudomonas sp.]
MSWVKKIERLDWRDPEIGQVDVPSGKLTLRQGFGSGLAVRPGDPPHHFFALGDRGPNIKVRDAMRLYGLHGLAPLSGIPGAKIMPRIDVGPTLAQLRIVGDVVELVLTLPLTSANGQPITGLPNPASDHLLSEPIFDLEGAPIDPDPQGLDTEGLAATRDGRFWVGDEFGPSLVQLDEAGVVIRRLDPGERTGKQEAGKLPAIAAKRQLNRGFEGLALSEDERWLYLAFQSPLAHPDKAAHRLARHVRIWRIDLATMEVVAQFAYPLDPPDSFARDAAAGAFDRSDIKVSELLWLSGDRLLVLERGSATTKLYLCPLFDAVALDPIHLDVATRPTLEELSAGPDPFDLPVLGKALIFSSDEHPAVSRDLEGMVLLSPSELLLVNDNDFGVEGAVTSFWRLTLSEPLA